MAIPFAQLLAHPPCSYAGTYAGRRHHRCHKSLGSLLLGVSLLLGLSALKRASDPRAWLSTPSEARVPSSPHAVLQGLQGSSAQSRRTCSGALLVFGLCGAGPPSAQADDLEKQGSRGFTEAENLENMKDGPGSKGGKLDAEELARLGRLAKLPQTQNLDDKAQEELWSKIMTVHPEWTNDPQVAARLYANRGSVRDLLGKSEEALADFSAAVAADPSAARAYVYRGYALEKLGRTEEALKDLERAQQLDPSNAVAVSSRGNVLMGLGKLLEAKEALKEAEGLFVKPKPASPAAAAEAALDGILPWSGLPRGFIFTLTSLAVVEYELGEEAQARKRIQVIQKLNEKTPLAAALAAEALMLQALNGIGPNGGLDSKAQEKWDQVEKIDRRFHKFAYASAAINWGPKLRDALLAFKNNRVIRD
ncbi:unnamed protein product [Polarella glacialis]|uniref:Uncharacterized protein n=1 Tax=Polarella glacialis TaxID=89957 RepID=A0A813IX75_POLGL|nr:unnamed protein product [Polarella glacialis]